MRLICFERDELFSLLGYFLYLLTDVLVIMHGDRHLLLKLLRKKHLLFLLYWLFHLLLLLGWLDELIFQLLGVHLHLLPLLLHQNRVSELLFQLRVYFDLLEALFDVDFGLTVPERTYFGVP